MLTVDFKQIDPKEFHNYESWLKLFETLQRHSINQVNWPDQYAYLPKVDFQILHCNTHIIIHYEIEEKYIRAENIEHNQNIWEDSCVEFFISFDNKKTYYNMEFNILGAGLIGFGDHVRSNRKRLSKEKINQINTFSSLNRQGNQKKWDLVLVIPARLFLSENTMLSGIIADANFYKCGDKLPTPHYVSWSPITSPKPNFHLPDFFGKICFM